MNDGTVYTSMPPKYKCTFTNKFHLGDHPCELDLVPVVRCGECKHQLVFEYTDRRFKNPVRRVYGCELSEDSPVCLDDEFCSRGERKGEEDGLE